MLNIGGTEFVTTEQTLIGQDTLFSALIRNRDNFAYDKIGEQYYFDRSPVVFPYILDYLRSGNSDLVCYTMLHYTILHYTLLV